MPAKPRKPRSRQRGRGRSNSVHSPRVSQGDGEEVSQLPKPPPSKPNGTPFLRHHVVLSRPSTPDLARRLASLNGSSYTQTLNALRGGDDCTQSCEEATAGNGNSGVLPAGTGLKAVKQMRVGRPRMPALNIEEQNCVTGQNVDPSKERGSVSSSCDGPTLATVAVASAFNACALDTARVVAQLQNASADRGEADSNILLDAVPDARMRRKGGVASRLRRDVHNATDVQPAPTELELAIRGDEAEKRAQRGSALPIDNAPEIVTPPTGAPVTGGACNISNSPRGSMGSTSTFGALDTPLRRKAREVDHFLDRAAQVTEDDKAAHPCPIELCEGQQGCASMSTKQSSIPAPRPVAQEAAAPPDGLPVPAHHATSVLVSPWRTINAQATTTSRRLSMVSTMRQTVAAASKASLAEGTVAASRRSPQRMVVVDTSTLLESDLKVLNFLKEKWVLCIPFTVIDELDWMHKGKPNADKRRRRGESRDTEDLQRRARDLRNWISAALGQKDPNLRVQRRSEIHDAYDRMTSCNDDNILGFAVYLKEKGERHVMFVTEDKFLRLKAQSELGEAYRYTDLKRMMGV